MGQNLNFWDSPLTPWPLWYWTTPGILVSSEDTRKRKVRETNIECRKSKICHLIFQLGFWIFTLKAKIVMIREGRQRLRILQIKKWFLWSPTESCYCYFLSSIRFFWHVPNHLPKLNCAYIKRPITDKSPMTQRWRTLLFC